MTVTLATLTTEIQQRLGDSAAAIWTSAEVEQYIQQGYDQLTRRTGCLLGIALAPDYAFAFSFTQDWELDYIVADAYANGPAQFNYEFERDYIDNADGPANHTQHWEFNDSAGWVSTTEVSALSDLPADLYEIERSVWNTKRIQPLRSRDVETSDSRYELNKGQVEGYMQDKDGLARLRKYRVPSVAYTPYSFDSSSDDGFGIIRDLTGISDTDVISDGFGDLVQVNGVNVFEDYGILGPVFSEPNNVRIEYRRRGLQLSSDQDFEIPDRYTVYVRHFAQARSLERNGKGQDLKLAAHYQSRFETGIARMLKRKQAMNFQRAFVLGGSSSIRGQQPPRVRLPWQYGQVVR